MGTGEAIEKRQRTQMLASEASSVARTESASSSSAWKRVRVKKESTKSATAERDISKANGRWMSLLEVSTV